jgi:hypothetical protein
MFSIFAGRNLKDNPSGFWVSLDSVEKWQWGTFLYVVCYVKTQRIPAVMPPHNLLKEIITITSIKKIL